MIGAVDIGGTKIAVGIVDDAGRVQARLEFPTNPDQGYTHTIDRIALMLQQAARSAQSEITGIGIGCTGPVYPRTGEIGNVNFFPAWEHENPVRDLESQFHVPVAMENDA